MSTIKPTPSQAAVVLKKYLSSQGIDIPLHQAQEASARMNGFASFQAMAATVEMRSLAKQVGEFAEQEGFELYCITGRFHGDDDDSAEHYWTKEGVLDAIEQFKLEILDCRDLVESYDEFEKDIYVITSKCIGKIVNGHFILEDDLSPAALIS